MFHQLDILRRKIKNRNRRSLKKAFSGKNMHFEALENRIVLSHFRFGTAAWEPDAGNLQEIDFTIEQAWRRTFYTGTASDGRPAVGDIINVSSFTFGDGSSALIPLTITSINTAEDWMVGQATLSHTYTSNGNFTAAMNSCCRIFGLQNNSSGFFRTETVVNVGSGNASPVTSLAPIVQVADDSIVSIDLSSFAIDPDGDPLSFRFATSQEASGSSGGFIQPAGMTISSSGQLTWDIRDHVRNTSEGDFWSAQAMVIDSHGAKAPLDFILKIGQPAAQNMAATIAANPAGPFSPVAGQTISFTITASDSDGVITGLQALNAPSGMTLSPFSPGSTASRTVTFTPTQQQSNQTFAVTFQATDDDGATAQTSVQISPSANQNPSANAGGPYSVDEGGAFTLTGSGSDPEGTAVSFEWDLDYDGNPANFNVDATGSSTTFDASLMDGPLTRTVGLRVTDGFGLSTIATTIVDVQNVAPHSIDIGPDLTVDEGDTVTFSVLSFVDPGVADTHDFDWHIVRTSDNFLVQQGHDPTITFAPEDNDEYLVSVEVIDDDGGAGLAQITLTSLNVAPSVSGLALSDTDINEGDSTTLTGVIADAGSADTFTVEIDWDGDGLADETHAGIVAGAFSYAHTYLDDDPTATLSDTYTVGVIVTDDDGASVSQGGSGSSGPISVLGLGANSGQLASDSIFSSGDLAGTIDRSLTTAAFNAMSPSALRAAYDVILVTWASVSSLNLDWATRLLPYMQAGGDVIWEDPNNLGDIAAIVTPTFGSGSGATTITTAEPILTDGITGSFVNNHITFASWDPGLTAFLSNSGGTVGLFGSFGSGRIVLTGPDHDFHAVRPNNQYQALVNEYEWVSADNVSLEVTVNNVDPTITLDPVSMIDENGVATLTGTITDPGTLDTFTLDIDWGDPLSPSSTETYTFGVSSTGSQTFTLTHQYLDDNPSGSPSDSYAINVTVTDDDTGVGSDSTSVLVKNVNPTIALDPVAMIDENGTATLTGTISDVGTLDTFTLDIDWGDPLSPNNTQTYTFAASNTGSQTFTLTHQYLDDHPSGSPSDTYTINATVTDDDTGVGSDSTSVLVKNVNPTIALDPVTMIDENGTATLTGTISDVGTLDTFTVEIDWNADGNVGGPGEGATTLTQADLTLVSPGVYSFGASHQYLDDNPTATASDVYTISVMATDDDTGVGSATQTVTVNNVAPTLVLDPVASIDENGVAMLTGTIADPGTLDTFTLDIDWGDPLSPGNTQTYTFGASSTGSQTFTLTHQYLDDNPSGDPSNTYTISATVDDDDTGAGGDTQTVTVNNVAPAITQITSGAEECGNAHEDEPITLDLAFEDDGSLDVHTAVVDWGDGNSETIVLGVGDRTLQVDHDYAAGGVYTITVTLTDDDTGADSTTVLAVVSGVGLQDGVLQIIGTSGADHVTLNQTGNGTLKVHADFIAENGPRDFSLADVDRIFMLLCDGDDHATVSSGITLDAIIDGGAGDDHLNGGDGVNVILGREGDDHINGGSARDLLIGGLGADRIIGNPGRDLITGGVLQNSTTQARDTIADGSDILVLQARFKNATDEEIDDWRAGTDDFFSGLDLEVADDEGDEDQLTGSSADDWLLLFANDVATDEGSNGNGNGGGNNGNG